MKFSVITVVRNCAPYIKDCIDSVLSQSYRDIEYILIDGKSTDGTLDIIERYRNRLHKVVSEEDSGYAEAMNRGLKIASGDVVGFLNADDFYAHNNVLAHVVRAFGKSRADIVYGDVIYVKKEDKKKIVRYWQAEPYSAKKAMQGWMPPHPAFFAKREIYEKIGPLNTDFKISADYELVLRLVYRHRIDAFYMPEVLVNMRWGGKSNRGFGNIIKKMAEDYRACRMYGLGFSTVAMKNIRKLPQLFLR